MRVLLFLFRIPLIFVYPKILWFEVFIQKLRFLQHICTFESLKNL
jgi:hypothetical protein